MGFGGDDGDAGMGVGRGMVWRICSDEGRWAKVGGWFGGSAVTWVVGRRSGDGLEDLQ